MHCNVARQFFHPKYSPAMLTKAEFFCQFATDGGKKRSVFAVIPVLFLKGLFVFASFSDTNCPKYMFDLSGPEFIFNVKTGLIRKV